MQTLYVILIGLGVVIALVFSALVFITGKGDAMSGGGSVRTTFKGKASFDDFMSRLTLYLGIGFMGLMLIIDVIGHHAVNSAPK
ncbi:MAG: preprotein translocase subunit SecG [Chlorobia bacterium]|nr:preprotein translocase subunit SecG [Fimbriimonadaceae bacterium]